MAQKPIFAFACKLRGNEHESIYNATSAGKAKRQYHLDISDPCPDIKYTDIRVRKIGSAHTSKQFIRNAHYRGLPEVRCGQRVRVGQEHGTIVGHNSSANFDVLFDADSRYGEITLNVHPSELVLL